jgi:hypothetical protein
MATQLARLTAGTALAVALTLGCGIPAFADTATPAPEAPSGTTVEAPEGQPLVDDDPGTDPGEGGTDPGEGGTDPGEGGTDPGEGGTDPGEGGTDPGEGGTDPGEGGTDPGEGGTDPGEGGTDPGEGGTDPGEGGAQPGGESPASSPATKSSGDRGGEASHLAATGADSQAVILGSMGAGALLLGGASALLWSRAGVKLRRGVKGEAA